jgi:hypothetical protein
MGGTVGVRIPAGSSDFSSSFHKIHRLTRVKKMRGVENSKKHKK